MRTDLVIVLDRSGSMDIIKSDMQGALDGIIRENIENDKELGEKTRLTVTLFDNEINRLYTRKPIQEADRIRLEPRGMTSLYDAIGVTIRDCDAAFQVDPPDKVMLMIITDGMENNSSEYSASQIKSLIQEREQQWNWAVTYIGANQDAILEGEKMGFKASASITYGADADGVRELRDVASEQIRSVRQRIIERFEYSDEDRVRVKKPRNQEDKAKA